MRLGTAGCGRTRAAAVGPSTPLSHHHLAAPVGSRVRGVMGTCRDATIRRSEMGQTAEGDPLDERNASLSDEPSDVAKGHAAVDLLTEYVGCSSEQRVRALMEQSTTSPQHSRTLGRAVAVVTPLWYAFAVVLALSLRFVRFGRTNWRSIGSGRRVPQVVGNSDGVIGSGRHVLVI